MAARQAPQLRIFRNDFASLQRDGESQQGGARSIAVRLTGTKSNRDAVGARVIVETDRLRRTKIVQAGSGFLSQHSKELVIGLGASERVAKLTVVWPSGATQVLTEVALNTRVHVVEGGEVKTEPFAPPSVGKTTAAVPPPGSAPADTWLYEPFPAPDFSLQDVSGTTRSLAALKGKPAVVLLWSFDASAARAALDALGRGAGTLAQAGVGSIAIAVESPKDPGALRTVASAGVPVAVATRDVGLSYAILNRHLFMNRQDLRLPTCLLLDAGGNVVRAYREVVDVRADRERRERDRRDARANGSPGHCRSQARSIPDCRFATTCRTGASCSIRGSRQPPWSRSIAPRRRIPARPRFIGWARLLTRTGETARARAAFERALALQPDLAEANNDLGALLAQDGDLDAAIGRFRAALASMPDYPDALNNLGYALLLTRPRRRKPVRCTRRRSRCSRISPRRSTISGCSTGARVTWSAPSSTSAMR